MKLNDSLVTAEGAILRHARLAAPIARCDFGEENFEKTDSLSQSCRRHFMPLWTTKSFLMILLFALGCINEQFRVVICILFATRRDFAHRAFQTKLQHSHFHETLEKSEFLKGSWVVGCTAGCAGNIFRSHARAAHLRCVHTSLHSIFLCVGLFVPHPTSRGSVPVCVCVFSVYAPTWPSAPFWGTRCLT